jgi:hypothetical protein
MSTVHPLLSILVFIHTLSICSYPKVFFGRLFAIAVLVGTIIGACHYPLLILLKLVPGVKLYYVSKWSWLEAAKVMSLLDNFSKYGNRTPICLTPIVLESDVNAVSVQNSTFCQSELWCVRSKKVVYVLPLSAALCYLGWYNLSCKLLHVERKKNVAWVCRPSVEISFISAVGWHWCFSGCDILAPSALGRSRGKSRAGERKASDELHLVNWH